MILLVEDDNVQRQATADLLRRRGFRVREVATAEQGLAEVRRLRPKILVVDLVMPGSDFDGLALLREAAKVADWDLTRVIVTTAMPGEIRDLPCHSRVLCKPFEVDSLAQLIEHEAEALGILPEVKAGV